MNVYTIFFRYETCTRPIAVCYSERDVEDFLSNENAVKAAIIENGDFCNAEVKKVAELSYSYDYEMVSIEIVELPFYDSYDHKVEERRRQLKKAAELYREAAYEDIEDGYDDSYNYSMFKEVLK